MARAVPGTRHRIIASFSVTAPDAGKVHLAGSFNNWDANATHLTRDGSGALARLNIVKHWLGRLHYGDKDKRLVRPDRQVVFPYDVSNLEKRTAFEMTRAEEDESTKETQ